MVNAQKIVQLATFYTQNLRKLKKILSLIFLLLFFNSVEMKPKFEQKKFTLVY